MVLVLSLRPGESSVQAGEFSSKNSAVLPGSKPTASPQKDSAECTLEIIVGPSKGAIAGVVRDASTENPIEGVYVLAVDNSGHEDSDDSTDTKGEYSLEELWPDWYDVSFTHPGYYDTTITDVMVAPSGDTTILNVVLLPSPCFSINFLRGDINGDGWVPTIADYVALWDYLYVSPDIGAFLAACDDAFDVNDDGFVDISDVMYYESYLWNWPLSPPPPPPFDSCGTDPTPDPLCCDSFPACNPKTSSSEPIAEKPNALSPLRPMLKQNTLNGYGMLKIVCDGPKDPGDTTSVVIEAEAEVNLVEAIGIDEILYPSCFTPINVTFFNEAALADSTGWSYLTNESIECGDLDTLRLGIMFSWECDSQKYLYPSAGEQTMAEIAFEIREDASPGVYPISIPDHRAAFSVLGGTRNEPTIEVVDSIIVVGVHPHEEIPVLPKAIFLSQNYPNPFNPITEIRYNLPVGCQVRLEAYNILGQKVATLVDEKQKAGYKTIKWDASSLSSGIYLYRLQAGDFVQTRKMVVLK